MTNRLTILKSIMTNCILISEEQANAYKQAYDLNGSLDDRDGWKYYEGRKDVYKFLISIIENKHFEDIKDIKEMTNRLTILKSIMTNCILISEEQPNPYKQAYDLNGSLDDRDGWKYYEGRKDVYKFLISIIENKHFEDIKDIKELNI